MQAAVAAETVAVAVPSGHLHDQNVPEFPGAYFVADGLGDQRIYELVGILRGEFRVARG